MSHGRGMNDEVSDGVGRIENAKQCTRDDKNKAKNKRSERCNTSHAGADQQVMSSA